MLEGSVAASNVNLDDRQAAERDVNEVITQNKPLSFDDFPANRPKNTDILHRSLVGSRTLKTRNDLQFVIAESVSAVHLSNFAEISLPRTSARRPTFPTFTRFSTARFAEMAASDLTVVALPASDPSNAKYALRFPVSLLVTDGKNMPITGLPPQGLGDSIGYPLFYDANTPLKSIPVRSSGAMYPANLSRALSSRMSSTYPDIQTTKTWAHMFQLSNDRDAQTILLQRVLGAATGDNHIALLLKAYLLYFDSVAACLEGVAASRVPLTSTNVVVNIASQNGWPAQLLNSGREMVNVLGGSNEYQEFWAYCCFDKAPIFAAITEDGGTSAVTMFSRYSLNSGGNGTTCLCDCDAYSSQREPDFFGKPSKILGHIESYVQRYALQQQANEALQIAMMWPTLYHTGAHISLPRPLHTVDWFGGEVEQTTIETSYRELAASDALVTLASTLAGALAVQSQVYDYVTLLSCERNTWALSPEAIRAAVAWLSAKISAPGAGWDFLLRHQFHVTPSFFYLTGLCSSSLDWEKLFSGLVLRESLFPAHLRLIQPFLVQSSVCCILPWQEIWKPDIELVGGRLCATPSTIMRLIRLGLIGEQPAHGYSPQLASEGIYPIISREGMETVEISASALDRLRVAREHGVRAFAIGEDESATRQFPHDLLGKFGYQKGRRNLFGYMQTATAQQQTFDPLRGNAKASFQSKGQSMPAISAASERLDRVKENLSLLKSSKLNSLLQGLSSKGKSMFFVSNVKEGESFSPLYQPDCEEQSIWWCIVYLVRMISASQTSLASVKCKISVALGGVPHDLSKVSEEEIAGLFSILDLNIVGVHGRKNFLRNRNENAQNFIVSQKCGQWAVFRFDQITSGLTQQAIKSTKARINLQNMPRNSFHTECIRTDDKNEKQMTPIQPHSGFSQESYNLLASVTLVDEAVRLFDLKLIAPKDMATIHSELFPKAGLPRFLSRADSCCQAPSALDESSKAGTSKCAEARELSPLDLFVGSMWTSDERKEAEELKSLCSDEASLCSQIWPNRSPENAAKNNITISEILKFIRTDDPQERLALWFVTSHQGNSSEFVTSVALWLSGVQLCNFAWRDLLSSGILFKNEDNWLEHSNRIHHQWRKGGLETCRCDSSWTQMLYLQALWGRGGVEVAWEKELGSKAKIPEDIFAFTGQHWASDYATEIIRESIREVITSAVDNLFIRTFDDFMDHAYEWLVSGSSAGLPSAFKDTPIRHALRKQYGIHPRATKRSVMEKIPRDVIISQLNNRPQIVAKLHQKLNETGGKARAIYGVTIWHYIFSNWLMAPFEKAIRHPYIDINLRNDAFLKLQVRRAQDAKRGAYFNSYDYPDFNSMHTHQHMALIYAEARNAAQSSNCMRKMARADSSLVSRGFFWLEEAVYTQVSYLAGPNEFIQSLGGLYSGNRDTTLVNTILNVAYSRVVDRSCQNMGLHPQVNWRLCHGDDIITQHETYGKALSWNLVADRANLKGQESKLLVERGYHEYLRILGCPDGKLRGSLARVVATFTNGNWESNSSPGVFAQIHELLSTLEVLRRRGMRDRTCRQLWICCLEKLKHRVPNHGSHRQQTLFYLRALQSEGFVDVRSSEDMAVGELERRIDERFSFSLHESDVQYDEGVEGEYQRRDRFEIERLFLKLPDEVTRPYMYKLLGALPQELRDQPGLTQRLKMALLKSTYGSELPNHFQLESKQTSQLSHLLKMIRIARKKRGFQTLRVALFRSSQIIGDHRIFTSVSRRIKAMHSLISAMRDLGGFSKVELLAHLCRTSKSMISAVLTSESILKESWQRIGRPSAAEVASLESEIEIYLNSDNFLTEDEEVVITCEDGVHGVVLLRDMMQY